LSAPEPETVGDVSGDRLDLHTNPAPAHGTLVLELTDDALHRFGRDREGNTDRATGRRVDRGVHANHAAIDIESGTTGIAAIHRRVDLDEVIIGAGADVTPARRHDASSHGATEPERVADREHPVTDARRLVGEAHMREVVATI